VPPTSFVAGILRKQDRRHSACSRKAHACICPWQLDAKERMRKYCENLKRPFYARCVPAPGDQGEEENKRSRVFAFAV
jgi:hypothetical protein